jgi:hypothetical protein
MLSVGNTIIQDLQKFGGVCSVVESKWYNGRSYLPLFTYSTTFVYANWMVTIRYENRQSEFSKTNVFNFDDTSTDRHLINIKSVAQFKPNCSVFTIYFSKTFFFNTKCVVKSTDLLFKKSVSNSNSLTKLKALISNSALFEPFIEGVNYLDTFSIEINFINNKFIFTQLKSCMDLNTELIDGLDRIM